MKLTQYILGLSLLLALVASPDSVQAEGTPSFWKNYSGLSVADESGGYVLNFISNPTNGAYPGSSYTSDTLNRVYIHIDDFTAERINMGFNVRRIWFNGCGSIGTETGNYTSANTGGKRVTWRLKDPDGNIVLTSGSGGIPYWNGGATPSTVTGYIGTYVEARNGPDGLNGVVTTGYTPRTYNPTMNGDYYIEFNYGSLTTPFNSSGCSFASVEFAYFDLTVSNVSAAEAVLGRVWSRLWSLATHNRSPTQPIATNSSKFHVYTDDSIITRVDFDTISPGYWNVFANEQGVGSSGQFELDSRSQSSPATALQRKNKVFLNTPDTNIYPTRPITRTVSPIYVLKCSETESCIQVDLNRPSELSVYIEVNGTPGYQLNTSDVLLTNVQGERGLNCVPWNGLDGNGNPIPNGDTIFIQALFNSDVTQLPLQDVESCPNGLKITLELPISGQTAAYWNDTLINGGLNLTGCVSSPSSGCHSWSGDFSSGIGNGNVLNTYWYSTLDTLVTIVYYDSTFNVDFVEDSVIVACELNDSVDAGAVNITAFYGPPETDFRWTTSGGGSFFPHDSTLDAVYLPTANEQLYGGTIKLYLGAREGCPDVRDSVVIDFGKRPGGVDRGIYTWLKANEGPLNTTSTPAVNGELVETWFDMTNQGNDASAILAGPFLLDGSFNRNPGLQFNNLVGDGLSLPYNLDGTSAVSGAGTYVAGSSTGIINGANATGEPDGSFAQVYDTGDRLVIDFGQVLPVGTDYTLTWRRKSSYGFGPTADMVVEESTSPGSGYSTNSVVPQTTSTTSFINTAMTTEVNTRYVRLRTQTGTDDDFDFDAVTFSIPVQDGEAVFLVALNSTNANNTYLADADNANRRKVYTDGSNNPILRIDGTGTTTNASPNYGLDVPFVSSLEISPNRTERWNVNGATNYSAEFGSVGNTAELVIGNNSALLEPLTGQIAEVIVYNTDLNTNERYRIETYLAIKYGLTLPHNYLNADQTVIFTADGSGANVFDNDIGGIGQSICRQGFSQPFSASVNADAVISMSQPSSLEDGDYMLWGNDNGSLNDEDSSDVNLSYFTHRLDRVWKADSTGDIGTVRVGFYLGNIGLTFTDINDYALVISGSTSLSNGFYGPYPKELVNDTLYFSNVDLGDQEYFTLATQLVDSDGDGIGDVYDSDADNDGIPDSLEHDGIADPMGDDDRDGVPNYEDPDNPDCGGIVNGVCANYDNDGDGVPNFRDQDSDNDGILDLFESGISADLLAVIDADANGQIDLSFPVGTNGITDTLETTPDSGVLTYTVDDRDGDGFISAQDLDADNDGITDLAENPSGSAVDANNDGIVDGSTDADSDGILSSADSDEAVLGSPGSFPTDSDSDGLFDHFDLDSDNDGIPDLQENTGSSATDANNDGVVDGSTDADGDGILSSADSDDATRGAANSVPKDQDGDGLSNAIDLDSDGDGISDFNENQNGTGVDSDNNGRVDGAADADGDGILDSVDSNDGIFGSPNTTTSDDDGDGVADFEDIDSDNDGITDNVEGQTTAAYAAPSGLDTDGDGLDNTYDADDGGSYLTAPDVDSDGTPDVFDADSDDDTLPDAVEGHDMDGDGFADASSPANTGFSGGSTDADGDGLLDGWDNNTSSTDATNGGLGPNDHPDVVNPGDDRDWRQIRDTDNDGVADINDLDADNDGIPNSIEAEGNDPEGDEDGDGIRNWLDTTDNGNGGDGSTTDYTDANGDGIPDVYDFDYDGIPNHLDKDSDNDGIVDIVEAGGNDANNDGEIDYPTPGDPSSMVDADGDGLSDNIDDVDSGSGGGEVTNGTPLSNPDTDGDGNDDRVDIDSDGDGIIDNIEAQVTSGTPLQATATDTDGDGISDVFDPDNGGTYLSPLDTDGDGTPDYLDLDSDGDGESDAIEGWDTDGDGTADTTPSGNDTDGDGLDNAFDNYNNATPSATSNPSNNGQDALDFPDTDGGASERDWREQPCENGVVTLASFNGTTAADNSCFQDPWTYYYNPSDPTELLFAIEKFPAGGNTSDFTAEVSLTVSIDPTTSAGVYSAEDVPNEQATFVMGRYWNINVTSGSLNGDVNIRFFIDPAEVDTLKATAQAWNQANAGGTQFVSGLRWFAMNTNTFAPTLPDLQPGGILGAQEWTPSDSSDIDGVTFVEFSTSTLTGGSMAYTVGANSVILPVELISFTARVTPERDVMLEWATASEMNSDRFEIERSDDLRSWQFVGEVRAAGYSNKEIRYRLRDGDPLVGTSYYRLLQMDFDGATDTSDVRVVHILENQNDFNAISVLPNPNKGSFQIVLSESYAAGQLELRSVSGQLIRFWELPITHGHNTAIEVDGLASGSYILLLNHDRGVETLKVIVQ